MLPLSHLPLAFLGLNGVDALLAVCATVGGVLFLLWLVMQFMGMDSDSDLDLGDVDVDASSPDTSGTADISFTLLSFQGLSAFLTMFGLVGLTFSLQLGTGPFLAVLGGCGAGLLTAYYIGRMFMFARRMESSGTIKLENAVGSEATVYLTVRPSGVGKIQLTVQNRLGIYEAISESDEAIETGAIVRVIRVIDGSRLLIERV